MGVPITDCEPIRKLHEPISTIDLLHCQSMKYAHPDDQIIEGWLNFAVHRHSPNQNPRPNTTPLDLIVIHGISLPPGEFGGEAIDALFTNCLNPKAHPYFEAIYDLKVSSHVLIRRDGSIFQYVSFDERAWHAGPSCYQGRENCNDFSIGIELEGTDDCPYETDQYQSLGRVIRCLTAHYPHLTSERITGHSDIAPDRKTDPGPYFDWNRLQQMLA